MTSHIYPTFAALTPRSAVAGRVLAADNRVRSALALITQPGERPTVATVAAAVGLSQSRIEHLFTATFGSPLVVVAIGYRQHLAARMLVNSSATVKIVQIECGYKHAANFSHHFRSHFNLSPSEYRRRTGAASLQQELPTGCSCAPPVRRLLSHLLIEATHYGD